MVNKPDCRICRALREMYNKETDCDNCLPYLYPENQDIMRVWLATRRQVITSAFNIIDINHLAVWKYIEKFEIKNQTEVFQGVIKLFDHFLEMEKNETQNSQ